MSWTLQITRLWTQHAGAQMPEIFQVPVCKASGIAYDRRGYTRLAELCLKGL